MPAPAYTIVDAKFHHCGPLARRICAGRWLAYREAGVDPKVRLRDCWGASLLAKSMIIDGRVVAMGGVTGSLMARSGTVWLVISSEAAAYPLALVKEARKQLRALLKVKPELRALIVAQDGPALRFAEILGFKRSGEPTHVEVSTISLIPTILRG